MAQFQLRPLFGQALRLFPVLGVLFAGLLAAHADGQQPGRVDGKQQRRAARPEFTERDWEGIFFADLFAEGLVGEPPAAGAVAMAANAAPQPAIEPGENSVVAAGAAGWSQLIGRDALENEIKQLQIALDTQLTTPGRFSTGYREVNWSFEMLATWVAVLMQYEGEVRWKDSAATVLAAASQAAITTRKPGDDSFRYATAVRQSLTDMIRGGPFETTEKPVEAVDWAAAVNRTTVMKNLDSRLPLLKAGTADNAAFSAAVEETLQHASAIAALARVLAQPGVDTADDESYVALAAAMEQAARELTSAVQASDFPGAQAAANRIEQSCNNCHGAWR
jgi:cytochrome c556